MVVAFETRYPLHRLILDRAPFFASALTPPWLEASAKEITLHPEDADANVTQKTFEAAVQRLYGYHEPDGVVDEPFAMLATACWLQMQDLIDDSVDAILRSLNSSNLGHAINRVTGSCYGKAGAKILAFAQCILIREGIDSPVTVFDDLPVDVVRDVVGSDGFYVRNEFDRWSFARNILDRKLRAISSALQLPTRSGRVKKAPRRLRRFQGRLRSFNEGVTESDTEEELTNECKAWIGFYSSPEIEPLHMLLDHGVYYMHLTFEQLQHIRSAKDTFGFPVVPEKQTSAALWESLELRQKVVNAKRDQLSLGLTQSSDEHLPTSFLKLNNSPRVSPSDAVPGLSSVAGSIASSTEPKTDDAPMKHWIPVNDCSVPLGRYPFDLATRRSRCSPRPDDKTALKSPFPITQTEEDLQTFPFSYIPPFRFAVQFEKPQYLPERKRIYSDTFFYAGSYWNIYIQKLQPSSRSKRIPRLGFYLHRTKGPDGDDGPLNFVDGRIHALECDMQRNNYPHIAGFRPLAVGTDTDDTTASHVRAAMHTLMQRPNHIAELHESTTSSLLDDQNHEIHSHAPRSPQIPAMPPYDDTRPTVRAYFKIHTITPNGRYLNVHQSVPDNFNFSQSWGWKSSTMMAEDEWSAGSDEELGGVSQKMAKLEVDVGGEMDMDKERGLEEGVGAEKGSEGKLRFMVAVGLV